MKKLLLLMFICLPALFGCNHKKIRRINHAAQISADTISENIDTALVSLKSLSATPLNEALCQLWKMDDAGQKHWNDLFWDSLKDKRKYPELALYNDYSVTENARCTVKFGKWNIDKKHRQLFLNFTDGTFKSYYIQKILVQKMVVIQKIGDDDVIISFSSDGLVRKKFSDDPFYPANNQWRVRPNAPESDEQILSRMKQYVHFYSLFFQDNNQRREKDISFIGLPNCFQWYNGGIGLIDKLNLDKKWMDCFYSEKEAYKGYEMLKRLIERHELKWPDNPTSWIKETHEILDQIHNKL